MQLKTAYYLQVFVINIIYFFPAFALNSPIIAQNGIQIKCLPEYLVNCSVTIKYPGTAKALISGIGTIIKPFPQETRVRVLLQQQLEDRNITFGNAIEHNACNYIKRDKLIYPGVLRYGNFPKTCPIQLITYFVNDYQVPIQDLPPIIPKGKLIANFYVTSKNIVFCELNWFGEVAYN